MAKDILQKLLPYLYIQALWAAYNCIQINNRERIKHIRVLYLKVPCGVFL